MKNCLLLLPALLVAGALTSAAGAQETALVPAPSGTVILREGAEVKLKFAGTINSKTAAVDDPVVLVLDEDLRVGDALVARAGAKAIATVSNAKKAGMMGKPGELNIRLESLKAGDNKVRLRGTKGRDAVDPIFETAS